MALTYGGKTVYGATVGIMMLESQFPRIPGDMGNAMSWSFPVQYRVVRGASPDKVVRGEATALLETFIEAGKDLVASGCDGITTNCGFLILMQQALREALGVPVATSSLLQYSMIQQLLPAGQRVGIITINPATLSAQHLAAAAIPLDTPIVGTHEDSEFTNKILDDQLQIDFEVCRTEMLEAAERLIGENHNIGAVLLECTNMVPYAADLRQLTGLPVFSIHTLVNWFQNALLPTTFNSTLADPRRR